MSEDLHALAAAYALDALDPLERRRFEAHYPDCASCAAEVAEFRETAARLPATAPAVLPPDLKAAVMAEVGRTRQLPPQLAGAPHPGRPRTFAIGVAAAVVVVALVGFALVVGRADRGVGDELAAVLAAPDAVTVRLEGTDAAADPTLRVVYSESQQQAVLVGSDLRAVDDDETYQLWTIQGAEPASSGVFRPAEDGQVERSVDPPDAPPDAWAVTVEPDGGSPAPTSDILFQGTPA